MSCGPQHSFERFFGQGWKYKEESVRIYFYNGIHIKASIRYIPFHLSLTYCKHYIEMNDMDEESYSSSSSSSSSSSDNNSTMYNDPSSYASMTSFNNINNNSSQSAQNKSKRKTDSSSSQPTSKSKSTHSHTNTNHDHDISMDNLSVAEISLPYDVLKLFRDEWEEEASYKMRSFATEATSYLDADKKVPLHPFLLALGKELLYFLERDFSKTYLRRILNTVEVKVFSDDIYAAAMRITTTVVSITVNLYGALKIVKSMSMMLDRIERLHREPQLRTATPYERKVVNPHFGRHDEDRYELSYDVKNPHIRERMRYLLFRALIVKKYRLHLAKNVLLLVNNFKKGRLYTPHDFSETMSNKHPSFLNYNPLFTQLSLLDAQLLAFMRMNSPVTSTFSEGFHLGADGVLITGSQMYSIDDYDNIFPFNHHRLYLYIGHPIGNRMTKEIEQLERYFNNSKLSYQTLSTMGRDNGVAYVINDYLSQHDQEQLILKEKDPIRMQSYRNE